MRPCRSGEDCPSKLCKGLHPSLHLAVPQRNRGSTFPRRFHSSRKWFWAPTKCCLHQHPCGKSLRHRDHSRRIEPAQPCDHGCFVTNDKLTNPQRSAPCSFDNTTSGFRTAHRFTGFSLVKGNRASRLVCTTSTRRSLRKHVAQPRQDMVHNPRSLAEILRRGRWRTEQSVRCYATSSILHRHLSQLTLTLPNTVSRRRTMLNTSCPAKCVRLSP